MSKEPKDPNFESRVRNNFGEQIVMHTIGARLTHLEAGKAEIEMPTRDDLAQQNGYVHAGIVTTILDSGCGYAALSMWPAGSVEAKPLTPTKWAAAVSVPAARSSSSKAAP